jgi:hypothetical protein
MNLIYKYLIEHNKEDILLFAEWYNKTYPGTISIFSLLPFPHQIGVFLQYFESRYGFSVLADNTGYVIYYCNNTFVKHNIIERFEHKGAFDFAKDVSTPSTTLTDQYSRAIMYLFNNLDLPF